MFLAETIFQQQEGTLWDIQTALWWIFAALVIVAVTGFVGVVWLSKLRDVGLALLEEQRKQSKLLESPDRGYERSMKPQKTSKPAESVEAASAEVYRI